MAKSIKIGSFWIELSEDNHLDAHQSEASTLRGDDQSEQHVRAQVIDDANEVDDMVIDDSNEVELVKSTVKPMLGLAEEACPSNEMAIQLCRTSESIKVSNDASKVNSQGMKVSTNTQKKIRMLADSFKELDTKERIYHPTKKSIRTSNMQVDDVWNQNVIPTVKVEDDELSIRDKGKNKMEEIHEDDSDSSSSWNEDRLAFATHSQIFPRDPLLYGEGASKFFEENSVPYDDVDDDTVMDGDDIIMNDDDDGYDSDIDEEELKKNPKKRKWGKD